MKNNILIGGAGLLVGFLLVAFFVRGGDISGSEILASKLGHTEAFASLGKLSYRDSLPPGKGRAAVVSVDTGQVTLYRDNNIIAVLPIISIAPANSPWETPAGRFMVLKKEASHFSPIAQIAFPYAVQFFGNSFFHAPAATDSAKSGKVDKNIGSIKLNEVNAKKLFNFLSVGDAVIVKRAEAKNFLSIERLASIGAIIPDYTPVPKTVLKLSGRSYYVADLDTGEVIMSRDENSVRSIASVSKLFTAITATEAFSKDSLITVSDRAVATLGVEGGLVAGERMPLSQMLYPLLLESSNDAAEAIAESLGREKFISEMNRTAERLGLEKTSFADPSGLNARNVSTAKELFRLAQYIYTNRSDILTVSRTNKYKILPISAKTVTQSWINHNKFVVTADPRYVGGKTGFINESGLTSIALFSLPLAEFSKKNIGVVILNSANRDHDNKLILDALYDSLAYISGMTVRQVQKIPTEPLFVDEEIMRRYSLIFVGNVAPEETEPNALAPYFTNLSFLRTATIAIASVEGPISDRGYEVGAGNPSHLPASFAKNLADAGIGAVALSNEHAGDYSRIALSDTLRNAYDAGITTFGAGEDSVSASELKVIKKDDVTFGFLNFSDNVPAWMLTPDNVPTVVSADMKKAEEAVMAAKGRTQFLSVIYNTGENGDLSAEEFTAGAKRLIDAGADIVVRVGPHKTGDVVRYKSGVIATNLGDFIDGKYIPGQSPPGMVLEVLIQSGSILEVNGARVNRDEKGIPYLLEDDL